MPESSAVQWGFWELLPLVGYPIVVLTIGLIESRRSQADEFLNMNGNVSLRDAVSTINAGKTGSIILLYMSMLANHRLGAISFFVGLSIGYLCFIPFARKIHHHSAGKYYNLSDYLTHRYGRRAGSAAAAMTILIMVGLLLLNLVAAKVTLIKFVPQSQGYASIIVAGVVLVYLVLAGFRGVVKTDFIQYIAIWGILAVCLAHLFFNVQNFEENPIQWMPDGDKWGTLCVASIVFLITGVLAPFASNDVWQRVYAMSSPERVRASILWSIPMHFGIGVVLTIIGLIALSNTVPPADKGSESATTMSGSELVEEEITESSPTNSHSEGHDYDFLLTMFANFGALRGLALTVFFAAFMSSIDTFAFAASASSVQTFWRSGTKATVVTRIRIVLVMILLLATALTYVVTTLGQLGFICSCLINVLAFPILFTRSRLWPAIREKAVVAAIATNFVLATSILALSFAFFRDIPGFVVLLTILTSLLGTAMSYWWNGLKPDLHKPND